MDYYIADDSRYISNSSTISISSTIAHIRSFIYEFEDINFSSRVALTTTNEQIIKRL
jgi:hypothetical protein